MAKQPKNIIIGHMSMQYSDNETQWKADLKRAATHDCAVISLTEQFRIHPTAQQFAETNGYRYLHRYDSGFLIKKSPFVRILDVKFVKVHGLLTYKDSDRMITGTHGVFMVKVRWYDEIIWFHTGHWLTYASAQKSGRHNLHRRMTESMGAQVKKHGVGNTLAFFSGDVNRGAGDNDFPNAMFKRLDLLTCWDEMGVYIGTHQARNRTLDVIGSYVRDKRVICKRVYVDRQFHSDHHMVIAVYRINPKSGSGSADPTTGDKGEGTDDPYLTGGNIDWSDYKDDTVEIVESAIDDTDGHTHF